MAHAPQIRIPATYMRGGTIKGVFFRLEDLPQAAQVPGKARDRLFQRVIGSPDPYAAQIDGMGGATSSTSKSVILSKSTRPGHDVDYLFGQVSIDKDFVDWSGNCGNLSTGAGAFAIHAGYDRCRTSCAGWRLHRAHLAGQHQQDHHRPCADHQRPGTGDRRFRAGWRDLPGRGDRSWSSWIHPMTVKKGGSLFPTGNLVDDLEVPGVGTFKATMINAGIPTVFVNAEDIGYTGTELREAINTDPAALARFEKIRVAGALRMGLIKTPKKPQPANIPRRSLLLRHRPTMSHPAARRSVLLKSICWCAPCRWANCTMP